TDLWSASWAVSDINASTFGAALSAKLTNSSNKTASVDSVRITVSYLTCGNGMVDAGEQCDDGAANGTAGSCCAVNCTFKAAGIVCRAAANQSDAAQTCTGSSDTCPADGLQPNGTACNDGNACTQTDTCQNGTCTGSSPVVCTALDQCHVAGTCDTATGLCSNPNASNGTACSDGNACTQTDTCQNGTCTGSSPVVCTAS